MELHIKNMVCDRCIKVVGDELKKLGMDVAEIGLGRVALKEAVSEKHKEVIREMLQQNGFELLDDKKQRLIERMKTLIINNVHGTKGGSPVNYSDYLSAEMGHDYSYLSNLFSATENITIEKYIILQKTELVKELLVYNEFTLSEIAYRLGYSSVAHLSAQFKKVTGLTPSHFKKIGLARRKTLDNVHGENKQA